MSRAEAEDEDGFCGGISIGAGNVLRGAFISVRVGVVTTVFVFVFVLLEVLL